MEKITLSYEQLQKLIKKYLYSIVDDEYEFLIEYLINDKKYLFQLVQQIKADK